MRSETAGADARRARYRRYRAPVSQLAETALVETAGSGEGVGAT